MSIYAKRIDESIITPKDDRILFDAIFDNYGLIYGGSAMMSAVNKINVGAARGFIKGTEIIIEEEDIAVELSDSGTKSGRLKIVVDYTNTENPVAFTSEVATSLPALEQDDLINYTNGIYEVAYATYTATETSISDVKLVMPTLETVKEKLKRINTDLDNVGKGMTVIWDYTSAFLAISYEYTALPISYDITQFRTILFDVWIEPNLLSRRTQEVSVIALRNEFPVIIQSSSQASTPYAISFLSSGTGLIYASSGNPVHCRIVGIK